MNIKLGDLKEGSLREITNDEIIYLKSILWYMYWGGDSIHGEITR